MYLKLDSVSGLHTYVSAVIPDSKEDAVRALCKVFIEPGGYVQLEDGNVLFITKAMLDNYEFILEMDE